MDRRLVTSNLDALRKWVESEGWSGHDPFDVRSHPFYLNWARRASGSSFARSVLGTIYHIERRFPRLARRLLRTQRLIVPKGMGLFARGYLMLAAEGDEEAEHEAARRLDWLAGHAVSSPGTTSWAYPFDWQSAVFLPAGTPSAVVTATVTDAFREQFDQTGEGADVVMGAAEFVARALRRPVETHEHVCFSYTPVDSMVVHNANVIAAELLAWAGHRFDQPEWRALGRRAFDYTIAHQDSKGAWDYWGPDDGHRHARHVDAYHTGFVLRMLMRAYRTSENPRYLESALRGYDFFNASLLDGVVPRYTDTRQYPVDGHAVAEALLTHLAFRAHENDADSRASELLAWANAHMRDPRGFYYYQWSPRRTSRIPMMRWVAAWMFLALAAWATEEETP